MTCWRDLIRACPPPERPFPVLSAQQSAPQRASRLNLRNEFPKMPRQSLDNHRSIDMRGTRAASGAVAITACVQCRHDAAGAGFRPVSVAVARARTAPGGCAIVRHGAAQRLSGATHRLTGRHPAQRPEPIVAIREHAPPGDRCGHRSASWTARDGSTATFCNHSKRRPRHPLPQRPAGSRAARAIRRGRTGIAQLTALMAAPRRLSVPFCQHPTGRKNASSEHTYGGPRGRRC